MSIKIAISQHVTFPVAGCITNADGTSEDFAFRLTARRLNHEELQQAHQDIVVGISQVGTNQPVTAKLQELVTGWFDVYDGKGEPVPFSAEAFTGLLRAYGDLNMIVWRAYQADAVAKAKN